jgi:16S rRNA (cytosine967-C5)-methyltransferase
MTPRALTSAIEIYERWQTEQKTTPLDRVMNAEVRSRRFLNSRERRWVQAIVYTTVRLLQRQKTLCEYLSLPETPENLIRLTAAAQGETELLPVSKEVWEVAWNRLPTPQNAADYLRTTLSFPDHLATELEALLGKEALAEADALNEQAPTTLRVNTLRVSREKAIAQLNEAIPTPYSPWGIVLPKREPLANLPGYESGWLEVQEEASQMVALLSEVKPGEKVLEVGAGGGGKTLALAAMMENRGKIYALDTAKARIDEMTRRVRHAGVKCVTPLHVGTDSSGYWKGTEKALPRDFDTVFIDSPCTGSGILRRNPDTKWRVVDEKVFTTRQAALLEQSSHYVRTGGRLCYVTCALERSQNERIVEAFLKSEAGASYTLEPVPEAFASFSHNGYFRSWAHRHNLDAFFMARLLKKE